MWREGGKGGKEERIEGLMECRSVGKDGLREEGKERRIEGS